MNIGIAFCSSETTRTKRELEQLADLEILEVAAAVQEALERQGHRAEEVDLNIHPLEYLYQFDWIFNLVETVYGYPLKDYEITSAMEAMGIPFTGCSSKVLKICSDKSLTKNILRKRNLLTPRYEVVKPGESVIPRLDFPLIVKPMREDGSVGISKNSVVYSSEMLFEKVNEIHAAYYQPALVEEYLEGRDISVALLGSRERPQVLPPAECVFRPSYEGARIQTFDSKWLADSADYQNCYTACPCELDGALLKHIEETCSKAYRILGCRDYARVDLRLVDHSPYIIEVNPNPCINPHDSGFVRAGKVAGYSFDDLIQMILTSSIVNWKYPIPTSTGANYGRFIKKTHSDRPAGDYPVITPN
jgi:D-alanine-D-alanine ligase